MRYAADLGPDVDCSARIYAATMAESREPSTFFIYGRGQHSVLDIHTLTAAVKTAKLRPNSASGSSPGMIKSRLMAIMVRRGSDSWILAASDPGVPEVLDLACAKINELSRGDRV